MKHDGINQNIIPGIWMGDRDLFNIKIGRGQEEPRIPAVD